MVKRKGGDHPTTRQDTQQGPVPAQGQSEERHDARPSKVLCVREDPQAQPEGVVPPSNLAVTAPATTAAPALTQTAATSLVPGRPSGKRSVPAPTAAEAPAKKKGKKVEAFDAAAAPAAAPVAIPNVADGPAPRGTRRSAPTPAPVPAKKAKEEDAVQLPSDVAAASAAAPIPTPSVVSASPPVAVDPFSAASSPPSAPTAAAPAAPKVVPVQYQALLQYVNKPICNSNFFQKLTNRQIVAACCLTTEDGLADLPTDPSELRQLFAIRLNEEMEMRYMLEEEQQQRRWDKVRRLQELDRALGLNVDDD